VAQGRAGRRLDLSIDDWRSGRGWSQHVGVGGGGVDREGGSGTESGNDNSIKVVTARPMRR
jgi:hypothetical protein